MPVVLTIEPDQVAGVALAGLTIEVRGRHVWGLVVALAVKPAAPWPPMPLGFG